MKRKALLFLFTALCLILPTTVMAAGKHALLIGIQDYSYHSGFASLRGPENDLRITKQVLRERFGFQEKDVLVLLNEEATHSGIEHAFKSLIGAVEPDDFVYIYYSGHGSQTEDLNGDELDGMDETWLSYGSRKDESEHKDNYDVLDDEIEAWLAALYEKSTNVVFVSDSCHSATVSRGQAAIARAVESDTRSHPLGKHSYIQAATHIGVRVGAARDRESAIEFPPRDDRYYGLFTWYWVRALQHARDGESWNDLFKRVYTRVTSGRGDVQRPQLWGERGLQVVVGGFKQIEATVPIADADDEMVTIGAGYLSGVTVGSVYRLEDPDNPNPPTLTIEKVKTFESLGRAEGQFEQGDLVIEKSHAYAFSPIKVYLNADAPEGADKPLLQAIRSVFQASPNETPALPAYTLTDIPQQAEIHLYLLHPKQENGRYIREANDVLPKLFPEQSPELWILTPEHRLLNEKLRIRFNELNPERGMQVLQKNLKKFARIRELKALSASRGSTLQIEAEAYLLIPVDSCQAKPDCRFLSDDLGLYQITGPHPLQEIEERTFSKKEILTFTLHNRSDWDYYYYLIDIAPNGAIEVIFPHPDAEPDHALVKAGEIRKLINDVGLMMEISGEESIKFIVSRQPFDASLLEKQGYKTRGGKKGKYNPLEQLLVNAMYGQRGRVSLRNDEWATRQISLEVE
ncbi:MAG: hypothetical protein GY801_04825 [bacterium]|nr:hypothetical protein [bacterium]